MLVNRGREKRKSVCLHFAYSLEPGRLGREMIAAVYNAAAGAGG